MKSDTATHSYDENDDSSVNGDYCFEIDDSINSLTVIDQIIKMAKVLNMKINFNIRLAHK